MSIENITQRFSKIFKRVFKKLLLFKVMMTVQEGATHAGGSVHVSEAQWTIFEIGKLQVFEVLSDAGDKHTCTELCVWVKAVDVEHAIERAMPVITYGRHEYLKDRLVKMGNSVRLFRDEDARDS